MTRLLPLAAATFFIVPLCNAQNDTLSIGGKPFRLGMTKHEALQLAPVSDNEHSKTLSTMDSGGDVYPVFRGAQPLGTIGFTNSRLTCIIASGPAYLPTTPLSDLGTYLIALFTKLSGGRATQITLWTETVHLATGEVTMERVHLSKPPYEYTMSKTTGIGQPTITFSEVLGTCRRAK